MMDLPRRLHWNDFGKFTEFHVTGQTWAGKRFKIVTTNRIHAFGINVWSGTVWGVLPNGQRKVLVRYFN